MTNDVLTDLIDAGVGSIAAALRNGTASAVGIAQAVIERVESRNGGAPSFDGAPEAINAWVSLAPDVTLAQAAEADRRLAAGDPSPLLGIPVGVKDLIGVAGQPLTASSRVREGRVASADSAGWAALAAAGAVFVGKTHTHEFGCGGTTDQVGNPWDLTRSPGGSSGGSAAALASGMVPLALGTDTAASLRVPAAFCGVSAFKPSFGRVPTDGLIPCGYTFDHLGPMARTLADCVSALEVLSAASRSRDPWGVASRPPIVAEVLADLRGVRIAMTDRPDNVGLAVDQEILDGLAAARAALESLGAEVVELPAAPDFARSDYHAILLAESQDAHAEYAGLEDRYRPSTREFLAPGSTPIPSDTYLAAQRRRLAGAAAWDEWFVANRIDAILEPTTAAGPGVRGHGYDAGAGIGGEDPLTCFTATWNSAGSPVAAIPTGLGATSGLPVGASLIGRVDHDARLLGIGVALQAVLAPPQLEWDGARA